MNATSGYITSTERAAFWDKHDACIKWCTDNLSSRGVLWEYDVNKINTADWAYYFAQPQDAIMFRLVHSV